jgi:hypothetical protein
MGFPLSNEDSINPEDDQRDPLGAPPAAEQGSHGSHRADMLNYLFWPGFWDASLPELGTVDDGWTSGLDSVALPEPGTVDDGWTSGLDSVALPEPGTVDGDGGN